jgi:hypothetical protein
VDVAFSPGVRWLGWSNYLFVWTRITSSVTPQRGRRRAAEVLMAVVGLAALSRYAPGPYP